MIIEPLFYIDIEFRVCRYNVFVCLFVYIQRLMPFLSNHNVTSYLSTKYKRFS